MHMKQETKTDKRLETKSFSHTRESLWSWRTPELNRANLTPYQKRSESGNPGGIEPLNTLSFVKHSINGKISKWTMIIGMHHQNSVKP